MSIFGPSKQTEPSPGTIGTLPAVPIYVSVLTAVGVAALIGAYAQWPTQRKTLEFAVLATGVAGGLLGAYYVWLGLKTTFQQREATRKEEQIRTAFRYVERLNDPRMAQVRATFRAVVKECRENKCDIIQLMQKDDGKRTAAADVTNLMEEIGYATKSGVADRDTIQEHVAGVVIGYFVVLRPWVDHLRHDRNRGKILEHFEWLYDQFKKT